MFGPKPLDLPAILVEPTFEERLSAQRLAAGDARSQFLIAALTLEASANELDILATDTQKELDSLTDILTAAIEDSDKNRASARKLRHLVEATDDLTLF